MKRNSIWLDYLDKNNEKKLDKNISVDVLIIGGGISGVSALYYLRNSNLKVALVERDKIGSGVTSKSTAKITFLQENIYSKLKKYHSEETAKLYLEAECLAIKEITNIIKINNIDCDLEESSSCLFTDKEKEIKKLKAEKDLLEKFNIKTEEITTDFDCKYAFKVSDTYVFNPIKYLNKLKEIIKNKNTSIYEDTNILEIRKEADYYLAKTTNNTIKCKYVVIASHYPFFLLPYLFPMKVSLEKSYIEAYQCSKNDKYNAINIGKPTKSIRYYTDKDKTYKIELGESHNICIKNNELNNFHNLEKRINKERDYYWSNIDVMTSDFLPLIGALKDKILIGTGYNTWGMTNSTIAGMVLSDIILERENKYIKLFNPKRGINLANLFNFPIILSSNIYSFLNSKINLNKSWYSKNIRFDVRDGKKVAIYKDKEDIEHIVYIACPHLKCNLIFNEAELTWDCPCHGSRFDIDGKCIEGPSNYNISYKENK